jgi:hypothetical protein
MGESKKRWADVAANYTSNKEDIISGVVGLGANRLGASVNSKSVLSEATKISTIVESTAADRNDVYKFIKDNAIHRLSRDIAMERASERFTNPIEELQNIVDDAILSDDESQVESIDSHYGYSAAPIGESLRSAFKSGWATIVESESKQKKPVTPIVEGFKPGYYRTEEDTLIDNLGRTAADRLMGN